MWQRIAASTTKGAAASKPWIGAVCTTAAAFTAVSLHSDHAASVDAFSLPASTSASYGGSSPMMVRGSGRGGGGGGGVYNAFFEATSSHRSSCDSGSAAVPLSPDGGRQNVRQQSSSPRFSVWPLSLLSSSSSSSSSEETASIPSSEEGSSQQQQQQQQQQPGLKIGEESSFERVEWAGRYTDKQHAINGTLMGATMIEAYELYRPKVIAGIDPATEDGADRLVMVARIGFGTHLNGHGGVVHGGILGLMLDDAIGCGCYEAALSVMPSAFNQTIVTANLNIDYRRPVMQGTKVLIEVVLERWEGRKFFLKARMIDAEKQDEETGEDVLYAEATSLYILLKNKK